MYGNFNTRSRFKAIDSPDPTENRAASQHWTSWTQGNKDLLEAVQKEVVRATSKLKAETSVSDPYSLNPDLDPAKHLNPDPDPSYFSTLSENNNKLFHNYTIFYSKEVH